MNTERAQVALIDLLTLLATSAALGGALAAGRLAHANVASMVVVGTVGLVLGLGCTLAMGLFVRSAFVTRTPGTSVPLIHVLAFVWVGSAGFLGMVTASEVLRLLRLAG